MIYDPIGHLQCIWQRSHDYEQDGAVLECQRCGKGRSVLPSPLTSAFLIVLGYLLVDLRRFVRWVKGLGGNGGSEA